MTIDEFKEKIAPHMRRGYIAMDKDGEYLWHEKRPTKQAGFYWRNKGLIFEIGIFFNIKPVKDWTKSLIKVG